MTYKVYHKAFQELCQTKAHGNFRKVAEAARVLADAADQMQQNFERRQQSLAVRCNHPRVDAAGICEICGAVLTTPFPSQPSTIN